jgi:hypothetical protein
MGAAWCLNTGGTFFLTRPISHQKSPPTKHKIILEQGPMCLLL